MTAVIHRNKRHPRDISDRRRVAFERAHRSRNGGRGLRSRYQENITSDPKPLGFMVIGAVTVILVLFGLVMVLSASSIVSFHNGGSPWKYFIRQSGWAVFGAIALVLAYRFPLSLLHKVSAVFPWIGLALMSAAFVPGLGIRVNGARAWLRIGDQSFQPSEFMKLAIIIYGADLLSKRESEMSDVRRTMWPFLAVAGMGAGLAVLQSDIGSCLVMTGIAFAVLFLAGAPLRPILLTFCGLGVGGYLMIRSSPEKFARLTSFRNLHATRGDNGYQVYQALISLSNGGLTGTGIGTGAGKWGYVPLAHSDFIFAILAEEMGLLGVLGLLTLFVFLIYFGLQVALSCNTRFGLLLAGGISSWFFIQVIINIGGVMGVMPVTGLTLPFISFGGSSLVASMIAAGFLMNVARRPR